MSVLRTIEQKIEGLFEGIFGRAFRTHVQPVELARKLTKEMDDHRMASVSRTYAPNEFTLFLSSGDRTQFADYEDSLVLELQDFLAEHARREGYVLLSPPTVTIDTDKELPLGHFGIATRMVQSSRTAERPRRGAEPVLPPPIPELESSESDVFGSFALAEVAAPPLVVPPVVPPVAATVVPTVAAAAPSSDTMLYTPPTPDPDPAAAAAHEGVAALVGESGRHALDRPTVALGRAKDCDIVVADLNVSRRHAEVRLENGEHWLVDLGSTNGTSVNGTRVSRAKLENGDRIELGSTGFVFERSER